MNRSFALCCALLAACSSKKEPPPTASNPPVTTPSTPGDTAMPTTPIDAEAVAPVAIGLDVEGMDKTVAPGDDFFAFANGTWLKTTEIPADRSGYGTGAILVELTAKRTADLIKDAAAKAESGSEARKIGDTYNAFMDEAAIETKGTAPLKPALDKAAAITNPTELAKALGETLRADVDPINNTNFETPNVFGVWIAQDLSDPTRYVPFLLQGGLLLPDRDYYLDPAPRMAEIRTKYLAHIAAMLKLAGLADPDAKAKRIFELEKAIAKVHATRTESSEVHDGNNHWARADFTKRAPGLDWATFLTAAGLDKQEDFTVWHPKALIGIAALVKSQPLDAWKDYLALHAIARSAPFLPKAFVDESFAFQGGVLAGTPKLRERWKRAVSVTNDALGMAVGKLYAEKYFPAAEKARAETMVKNVLAAFGRRIDKLEWMSPATKVKAKAKLAVLKVGVGYPDQWRDYAGLEVTAGDALGNAERASVFEYKRNLAKLGKPVDRGEWVMNPQLVNAVNLPAMNAMNFPAAILQPPYFDPNRPAVMDYGSIGAIIGHEISHSFDDQGALFDATGKLENWWTPADLAHFKASAAKLAKQYNGYRPFPDLAVNGTLTLGENIADVAGLSAAYDAYRLSLDGKDAPDVQGFTGDQQFFLSFAQSWRGKFREPAARSRILTDGHAPVEYRADTVRNLDPWYDAFAVKSGKLYLAPADRVRLW